MKQTCIIVTPFYCILLPPPWSEGSKACSHHPLPPPPPVAALSSPTTRLSYAFTSPYRSMSALATISVTATSTIAACWLHRSAAEKVVCVY
jgi:hypothetical protein